MQSRVWVRNWAAWAPGLETAADWQAWAAGEKQPLQSNDWPGLAHLDSMFKRRLSQLTRMVLQVGHELCAGAGDIRVVFASHYGEINQQFKISRGLIESSEVAPAAFSLSVFNTPVALLSIAEKNHGYASALYGGSDSFGTALLEALALLKSDSSQPVLLLAADELLPADYESLVPGRNQPYGLGLLLAANPDGAGLEIACESGQPLPASGGGALGDGFAFLSWFLAKNSPELDLYSQNAKWNFRRSL